MRFLTLIEVLELHRKVLEQSGGVLGIRDLGFLESAIAQPRMTFGGEGLYPGVLEKAAAASLCVVYRRSTLALCLAVQICPQASL